MAKHLMVAVKIPIRESAEKFDEEVFKHSVKIVPSDINDAHKIELNGDILIDSLAEIKTVKIIDDEE